MLFIILGNCKASFCESIVLLVGSILVSITNKNEASWNVVIESGLAVTLLKSFRSFVLHEEVNKVGFIRLFLEFKIFYRNFSQKLLTLL